MYAVNSVLWIPSPSLLSVRFHIPIKKNTDAIISNSRIPHFGPFERFNVGTFICFFTFGRRNCIGSLFRALMSLSYFDDAEEQFMPKMFSNVSWEEMKTYILAQVESYSKD